MNDGPACNPQPVPSTPTASAAGPSLPSILRRAWSRLRGNRTYVLVTAGLLYLLGAEIGLWECNEELLNAVGLGALLTLRTAINRSTATTTSNP